MPSSPLGSNMDGYYRLDMANPFACGVWEDMWREDGYANGDPSAEPGTREHFLSVLPLWLWFVFAFRPGRRDS